MPIRGERPGRKPLPPALFGASIAQFLSASLIWAENADVFSGAIAGIASALISWPEDADISASFGAVNIPASMAWLESADANALGAAAIVGNALGWIESSDATAIVSQAILSGFITWSETSDAVLIDLAAGTAEINDALSLAGAVSDAPNQQFIYAKNAMFLSMARHTRKRHDEEVLLMGAG